LLLSIEERTLTFHSLSLFRPVTENDAWRRSSKIAKREVWNSNHHSTSGSIIRPIKWGERTVASISLGLSSSSCNMKSLKRLNDHVDGIQTVAHHLGTLPTII
jgi:hypothetical protein